jgi:hypothetical protein
VTARRVYQVLVTYPEGSREPGWRPACWGDPAFLMSLPRKERRALAAREFRWPRERMFLSASGAYSRAMLLHWYGAGAEVLPSDPVTWPERVLPPEPAEPSAVPPLQSATCWPDSGPGAYVQETWEDGACMRWDPGVPVLAEKLDDYETGKVRRALAGELR